MAIFGFRLDDIPRLQLGIPGAEQSSWIRLFMMRISDSWFSERLPDSPSLLSHHWGNS